MAGLNFNKDGIKGHWAENIMNVAQVAATVITLGYASAATAPQEAAKIAAVRTAADLTQLGVTLYQGYLSQGTLSSRYMNWRQESSSSHLGFRSDNKYWLDDTRTEHSFGALYMGSTHNSSLSAVFSPPDYTNPSLDTDWPRLYNPADPSQMSPVKGFKKSAGGGAVSTNDMFTYTSPDQSYGNHTSSTHIAYDQFKVMSAGVGGTISPYRMEIGSLAQPNRLSLRNNSFNLIPFIEENNTGNKVQFNYNGQFSNKYTYHDDQEFGISTAAVDYSGRKFLRYNVTSEKLKSSRVEVDQSRLKNKKVVSGKNIEWYSNEEISSGSASTLGFVDYKPIQTYRSVLPKNGIGGFSITKEDGQTYHYALPVYRSYEGDFIGKKGEEAQKYSYSSNTNKVAITWLLTAITGADYVDRGELGLLDNEDWGYWTKFSYGKTTSDYYYRTPYYGYFDDGANLSYSQGCREEYYLNSIETRSHTALFIKGVRTDALPSYIKKNNPASGHSTESGFPVAIPPLFLDEIVLLSKGQMTELTSLGFNEAVNSSMGLPTLWENNGKLDKVYDIADVQSNAAFRTFINSNSLRRVKFGYEADDAKKLCKKTLNSFASFGDPPATDATDIYAGKRGKLTLKKLQFFGKNSFKPFPDYKFEYAYNPDYNKNHWDGWGMYNPNATSVLASHIASQDDQDGAAWSLTKITLPTGGQINVDYERDTYSSISGEKILATPIQQNNITPSFTYNGPSTLPSKVYVSNPYSFKIGEEVKVKGTFTYNYNGAEYGNVYEQFLTVKSIESDGIVLPPNYVQMNYYPMQYNSFITVRSNQGTIQKLDKNKKGGDIRVSLISYTNEFGESLKTKYTYQKSDGSSSGVVAKEPELIRDKNNPDHFGLENIYDYPFTPVLYSKVTVHSGYNKINDDYNVEQEFDFVTPHRNMVNEVKNKISDEVIPGFQYYQGNNVYSNTVFLKHYLNKVDVKTSKIGKLTAIKTFNKNSDLVESQEFIYTQDPVNDQGKFTSGSILAEFTSINGLQDAYTFKLLRTAKTYYPYELSQIIYNKEGLMETKDYKSWDFFTGFPLVTENKSASNVRTREEKIPAYQIQFDQSSSGSNFTKPYAKMGLKGFDIFNKNMVSQEAAVYSYLLNSDGTVAGLLDANVTTWKDDWGNYRVFNASTTVYEDNFEGPQIWRVFSNYSWLGDYSRLRTDGSRNFAINDKFNFNPAAVNGLWKKVGSTTRYDHFSMPLESADMNNISSALKMGYDNKYQIAGAVNAKFNEIAFTSAEDLQSNGYFGGEIKKGSGTVVSSDSHTGTSSLSVSSGSAFIYKTPNLEANKSYKVSVWTNSINGRIYYKINGGAEIFSASPSDQKKIGNWYLIDFTVPPQATAFSVEVGVKTVSGTVLFDDFRLQPSDASMTCYVYNPNTNNIEYVLDNNNLYTRYEYNAIGTLGKTYGESFKYGERLLSESKNDFRRFHIDQ